MTREAVHIVHPFEPVFDSGSRILILGSLPSVKSREEGFYYGHPRNRFWPLLGKLYGETAPADIPGKKAFLLRHGLALWDVIAECEIRGSSDASVRGAVPVDIGRIMTEARIGRVVCNGALAGKLYRQHLERVTSMEPVILPSTSPANAAWTMERLSDAWKVIAE